MRGTLTVRTGAGVTTQGSLRFGPGPYLVVLTPAGGIYRVEATLQGPIPPG